jgi:hypothetical protein
MLEGLLLTKDDFLVLVQNYGTGVLLYDILKKSADDAWCWLLNLIKKATLFFI